jgi:hypothetical protein
MIFDPGNRTANREPAAASIDERHFALGPLARARKDLTGAP